VKIKSNPLCSRDGGPDLLKAGDWHEIDPPLMFREVFLGIHRAEWVRSRWKFVDGQVDATHEHRLPSGATVVLASSGRPRVAL